MIQLPFDELEKAITKLERSMSNLSSFMSAESSGQAGFRMLKDVLTEAFGEETMKDIVKPAGKYYLTMNKQIRENVKLIKEEANAKKEAWQESKKNLEDIRSQKETSEQQLQNIRSIIGNIYMDS